MFDLSHSETLFDKNSFNIWLLQGDNIIIVIILGHVNKTNQLEYRKLTIPSQNVVWAYQQVLGDLQAAQSTKFK